LQVIQYLAYNDLNDKRYHLIEEKR